MKSDDANERPARKPLPRQGLPATGVTRVGLYRQPRQAHDHGLVILAMGLSYWLIPEEGRYGLYVPSADADAVISQLQRYDRENRMWPPREEVLSQGPGSVSSLAVFVVTIWAFFVATDPELLEAGVLSSAFLGGEWWRPVTALTLHGDWGHLMGNTVAGIFFMLLVFRFAGYGLGWLAVVLSGALGNMINITILAGGGHRSIGASTAVFGALGLVVGFRILQAHRAGGWRFPKQLWIPLLGGVALLGLLGAGGERTDVLAHVWGFVVGAVMGASLGRLGVDQKADRLPHAAFATITLILLGGCWLAALAAA